jgi:hypothetical protein
MDALSDRVMLEDGLAERLQEAEFDLLDDYAHLRLTAQERAAVERYLLTHPQNRDRVLVARALGRLKSS